MVAEVFPFPFVFFDSCGAPSRALVSNSRPSLAASSRAAMVHCVSFSEYAPFLISFAMISENVDRGLL